MLEFQRQADQVAPTNLSVLLQGRTGVGKDYLASYIHARSALSKGPFISINMPAVPELLFESELFGYEKGAFTGAVSAKPGAVELAVGGTLFLNEVGEIPVAVQPKLLSYLDTGQHYRVGGRSARVSHARIISATNNNLPHMVEKGTFRADLYFRLAGAIIEIPPLRERDDIEDVIQDLLHEWARKTRSKLPPQLSQEALRVLLDYHWPGNVRQLKHVLELAASGCSDCLISLDDLPTLPSYDDPHNLDHSDCLSVIVQVHPRQPLKKALYNATRELLTKALEASGGNITHASKLLGISKDACKYLKKIHVGEASRFNDG